MKLQELLSDLVTCRVQTVGNMSVIPLRGAGNEFTQVGTTRDLYLDRDVSYNSLVLGTRAQCVTIVPHGMALITKERAQDRAVPSTHLVYGAPKQVGAFCVQSSQCGFMLKQRGTEQQVRLLPLAVRREAYCRRGESSGTYASLWDKLGQWNRRSGVSGDFLVSYFRQYARELGQFVAQFELEPRQRGAIVVINGRVAGVEVAPHGDYFAALWEPLIRDCYGAEALLMRDEASPQAGDVLREVTSLDDLVLAVDELADRERRTAAGLVGSIEGLVFTARQDHALQGLSVVNLDGATLAGQGVQNAASKRLIYASLMAKPKSESTPQPTRRSWFRWN